MIFEKWAFTYCVCIKTPVLEAHNIVEDWVDGSTEVVEEAGHVEKVPWYRNEDTW